jgi:hypothetical protein
VKFCQCSEARPGFPTPSQWKYTQTPAARTVVRIAMSFLPDGQLGKLGDQRSRLRLGEQTPGLCNTQIDTTGAKQR